jgi:hypothetical protein
MANEQQPVTESEHKIIFPAQCSCGHLFLENYTLNDTQPGDPVAFCWCGFCSTRLNIFADNTFLYVQKKPERVSEEALRYYADIQQGEWVSSDKRKLASELLALRKEVQAMQSVCDLVRSSVKNIYNTGDTLDEIIAAIDALDELRKEPK